MIKSNNLTVIILFLVALTLGFGLGKTFTEFSSQTASETEEPPAPEYYGEQQAYQLLFESVTNLTPQKSCTNQDWKNLPLVIKPGNYCIDGNLYSLTNGLVRFYKLGDYNQSHIINNGNLTHILSALAWITTHGSQDEGKTIEQLIQSAKTQKLSLRCNFVSNFSREILKNLGYETRTVRLFSFNTNQEPGNQSHVAFEVKDKNKNWIFADLSGNHLFKSPDNQWMNALETTDRLKNSFNTVKFIPLASDPKFDATGFHDTHFNYTFFIERIYASETQLKKWYNDIFQGIFIQDNASHNFYYPNDSQTEQEAYHQLTNGPKLKIIGLPRKELVEKLYPSQ